VFVPGDNNLRTTFKGTPDKLVVRGIHNDDRFAGRYSDYLETGKDLAGQDDIDLRLAEAELGVSQDAERFFNDFFRAEGPGLSLLPKFNDLTW